MDNKITFPVLALGVSAMIGNGCSKENDQNPNVIFIIAD